MNTFRPEFRKQTLLCQNTSVYRHTRCGVVCWPAMLSRRPHAHENDGIKIIQRDKLL